MLPGEARCAAGVSGLTRGGGSDTTRHASADALVPGILCSGSGTPIASYAAERLVAMLRAHQDLRLLNAGEPIAVGAMVRAAGVAAETSRALAAALMALAVLCAASPAAGQTVEPPYDTNYTITALGPVPGLPSKAGGLTFLTGDSDTILIGGKATTGDGELFSIGVTRDGANHITGFVGTAALYADAPHVDGGVIYGPGNVLFLTRYPQKEIGQYKLGSTIPDKIVDIGALGVSRSPGGLSFVPGGWPGAGQLKTAGFQDDRWYTLDYLADGLGTYDITGATLETTIAGGPEGFVYVPPGSPQFADYGWMLVAEFGADQVAAYQVDANGDPILATRTPFVTGLTRVEGAAIDPLTGDAVFSLYGGGDWLFAVRGFAAPCGNGVLDPGEECDDGNNSDGDCCSSSCTVEPATTECRAAASPCDTAEHCTGSGSACPPDALAPAGTLCRPAAGACDVPEVCSGTGLACPADAKSTGVCRPAVGVCDIDESCDGIADHCPANGVVGDGTPCDDADLCTSGDACANGVCNGALTMTCGPCETCDPVEGCLSMPRSHCRQPLAAMRAALLLKNGGSDQKDQLAWKWTKGAETHTADFGDPTFTTDYTLCVHDRGGPAGAYRTVIAATVPAGGSCAGKPCWTPVKTKGFKYKDKACTAGGVDTVTLKSGGDGKAAVTVTGRGANLGLAADLDLTVPVLVQLHAGNGECWEATYSAAARNDTGQFKAKAD